MIYILCLVFPPSQPWYLAAARSLSSASLVFVELKIRVRLDGILRKRKNTEFLTPFPRRGFRMAGP